MKHVSATIIIICMCIYAVLLQWLYAGANRAFGLDIATVVLSTPIVVMFIALVLTLYWDSK